MEKHKGNRYALKFFHETNEDILRKKEEPTKEIIPVSNKDLEINSDSFFDHNIDFPKRPEWSYEMRKEEFDARENRYFTVCYNGCLVYLHFINYFFLGKHK